MGILTAYQAYRQIDKLTAIFNSINAAAVGYATQTLTITASGGTYRILSGALKTDPLAFNANAASIQTALQALANLSTNITASGGSSPFTLQYGGTLRGPRTLLTLDVSLLTGGSATIVPGTTPSAVVGIGDGTFGGSIKANDLGNLINALYDPNFADTDIQLGLSVASKGVQGYSASKAFSAWMSPYVSALSSVAAGARGVSSTIADIDTFLSWYNFGNASTYWQCLCPPEWQTAYNAVRSSNPSPKNLYYPCIQNGIVLGNTFTNALAAYNQATTTLTAGFTIDPTQFSGGYPFIQWTSGAGSGAVVITVVGLNHAGVAETYTVSGTWGSGLFQATNAGIQLVPVNLAYSLITSVTSVVITGMSAGLCFIESRQPSGRTYPPV